MHGCRGKVWREERSAVGNDGNLKQARSVLRSERCLTCLHHTRISVSRRCWQTTRRICGILCHQTAERSAESGFGSSGMTRVGQLSTGWKLRADHPAAVHPYGGCIVLKGRVTQWWKDMLLKMCPLPNCPRVLPQPRITYNFQQQVKSDKCSPPIGTRESVTSRPVYLGIHWNNFLEKFGSRLKCWHSACTDNTVVSTIKLFTWIHQSCS